MKKRFPVFYVLCAVATVSLCIINIALLIILANNAIIDFQNLLNTFIALMTDPGFPIRGKKTWKILPTVVVLIFLSLLIPVGRGNPVLIPIALVESLLACPPGIYLVFSSR